MKSLIQKSKDCRYQYIGFIHINPKTINSNAYQKLVLRRGGNGIRDTNYDNTYIVIKH